MKRSIALLMPLLLVLASCGTTAQYSQQLFQDGMYTTPRHDAAVIASQPYPEEYFEAQAASQIAQKQDSLKLFQDNGGTTTYTTTYNYSPYWGMSFGFSFWPGYYRPWNWYYNDWYWGWGGWYDPFYYPWHNSWWYDPWYGPYDPWYGPFDPWYGPYRPYRPYNPWIDPFYPVYPGGRGHGNVYYGPRNTTQSPRNTSFHPGTSGGNRRPGVPTYGSSGSSVTRSSGTGTGSTIRPTGGNGVRPVSPTSGTRTGSSNNQRVIRSVGSSAPTQSRSSSSSSTRSYSSSSNNTRSYSSSSSSSSRSSSSSSFGGGGGYSSGGYSGGGSSSHSGGGGGSHGGRR